jgi:hypothetical protein
MAWRPSRAGDFPMPLRIPNSVFHIPPWLTPRFTRDQRYLLKGAFTSGSSVG